MAAYVLIVLLWNTFSALLQAKGQQPCVRLGNTTTLCGVESLVSNTTMWAFYGIRYALSPTGPLRFAKPQPAAQPDVLNATRYMPSCPGIPYNETRMNEDCLFLNVFVPKVRVNDSLPVMVWIHGGAFYFGEARDVDPHVLAAEGHVIVVTVNYRLGPLGFLSTRDNSSVGNYGLWDQRLALVWVKDNIHYFGGNGSCVTIFGESAGAASVSYHTMSPASKDLFQRAIQHSGSFLSPWALSWGNKSASQAKKLAQDVGCQDPGKHADVISCLRLKDVKEIYAALSNFLDRQASFLDLLFYSWSPVEDGEFVVGHAAEDKTKFRGQIIAGVNNFEGGFMYALLLKLLLKPNALDEVRKPDFYLNSFIPFALEVTYPNQTHSAQDGSTTAKTARFLECVYHRDNSSSNLVIKEEEMAEILGDSQFIADTVKLLDREPSSSGAFMYYFDHYPDDPLYSKYGMSHALDLLYSFAFTPVLREKYYFSANISANDLKLSADYRTMLTNFAKTGNPNEPVALKGWPIWPQYRKGEQSYLSISFAPRVASHLKADKVAAWLDEVPRLLAGDSLTQNSSWKSCIVNLYSGSEEMALQFGVILFVAWCNLFFIVN